MKNLRFTLVFAFMAMQAGILYGQPLPCTFCEGGADDIVPTFTWQCHVCDTALNHTPAMHLNSTPTTSISIPYAKDYTMVAVCKPETAAETNLWNISFGDSVERGLTTERVLLRNGASDSTLIQYSPQTEKSPIVTTLRQSSPDVATPNVRLTIGGGAAMVAGEVLYYDRRLGDTAVRKVQSWLAIRYGITLGPVDYTDGKGRTIWDYVNNCPYHHRITGVGADSRTGLNQIRSRSEMDDAVLTIEATSPEPEDGSYLLVGDDDEALVFEEYADPDTGEPFHTLYRKWRAQATATGGQYFSMMFDKQALVPPNDSLVLLVDGAAFLPDSIGGDTLVFSGIEFSDGIHDIMLGCGSPLWQTALAGGVWQKTCVAEESGHDGETYSGVRVTAQAYPNPSNGQYTLVVSGADRVLVTIYNSRGSAVAAYSGGGRDRYTFEGELPSGNVYYAVIETDNGSQTIKLVVK